MFKNLFYWVGSRAQLLVFALAFIVAGNVVFQAYTHKTTPLLAWKGGGFGMYTEPHAEDRSVWLMFNGEKGVASVRLWPETPEFAAWQTKAGLRGTAFLSGIQTASNRFLFYPRKKSADEIIGLAARVVWPEEMVGNVRPIDGKVFKRNDISLVVYENRYNVETQTVVRTPVFEQNGGGASQ